MKRYIVASRVDEDSWTEEYTYDKYEDSRPDQLIDGLDHVLEDLGLNDDTAVVKGRTFHYYYDYEDYELGHVDYDEETYELKEMYENAWNEKDFYRRIKSWLTSVCDLDDVRKYEEELRYKERYL